MNREDIIRMAEKAGIVVTGDAVWKLCELVAAAEREACAKVAEAYEPRCDTCPSGVANAIRRRSLIDSIVQNERSARGQNDGH